MNPPAVLVEIDGDRTDFLPGEAVAGQYRLKHRAESAVEAVEVSILWHTEGKGDEDIGVLLFESHTASEASPLDLSAPRRFSARLPKSPLSYEGVILKIRWCVRVRVRFAGPAERVGEAYFRLGRVPPGREVVS